MLKPEELLPGMKLNWSMREANFLDPSPELPSEVDETRQELGEVLQRESPDGPNAGPWRRIDQDGFTTWEQVKSADKPKN